ncbi:uncharacterized protein LOC142324985 isoform X3 [Lycorma delicatula]|uniref:uncharacterized protein LOC142324985 isoform X3 n=1 Tax=Lycorma delicatula TaxID=130591 RepID=UPI003F51A1C6
MKKMVARKLLLVACAAVYSTGANIPENNEIMPQKNNNELIDNRLVNLKRGNDWKNEKSNVLQNRSNKRNDFQYLNYNKLTFPIRNFFFSDEIKNFFKLNKYEINNLKNDFKGSSNFNRKKREDLSSKQFRDEYPNEANSAKASVKAGEVAMKAARIAANAAKEAYRAIEDMIDAAVENGILRRLWKGFSRFIEDSFDYLFKWQSKPNDNDIKKFIKMSIGQVRRQDEFPRRY